MAGNASFGLFEPSDALLSALRSKVGRQSLVGGDDSDVVSGTSTNAISSTAPATKPNQQPEQLDYDHVVGRGVASSAPVSWSSPGVFARTVKTETSLSSIPVDTPIRSSSSSALNSKVTGRRANPPSSGYAPRHSLDSRDSSTLKGPLSGSGTPASASRASTRSHSSRRREGTGMSTGGGGGSSPSKPAVIPRRNPTVGGPAVVDKSFETTENHAMAEAADAALASALAKLGVEEEIRMSTEPTVAPDIEDFKSVGDIEGFRSVGETDMPRVPSVVTFGGQPVAVDGDLVYLGGGVYAAAAPPPEKRPPLAGKKPKLMPGRIRPGPRAAVGSTRPLPRSSSARGLLESDFANDSPLARSQSDGPGAFSDANSEKALASGGTRAWRPAGASKLPTAPVQSAMHPRRSYAPIEEIGDGGSYSEARARERDEVRKDSGNLFGAKGLLGELARMQEPAQPPRARVTGAPSASEVRAAERRAAKEARTEQILAEKYEREAAEALFRAPRSSSAPVLSSIPRSVLETPMGPSKDDLDRQKLRVACKMEMLDFFNGYAKSISKMNVDQTKDLLMKLHGGLQVANSAGPPSGRSHSSGKLTPGVGQTSPQAARVFAGSEKNDIREQDDDAGDLFTEWPDELDQADSQSIQGRLQQVNDFCNKAFDCTLVEEVGF